MRYTNLCPTCGYDLCPGDEDCRQRKYLHVRLNIPLVKHNWAGAG